jgi:hypothetical protein
MNKYIYFVLVSILFVSCYKEPKSVGFLSNNIYLKGNDTMNVSIGGKAETDYAWLDGSSIPCNFSIENIRDQSGNRSEQFFTNYEYLSWIKPYNFLTDTTLAAVTAKLSNQKMPCFFINPVNGQLQYVETTSNLTKPGDIFHVDVRVTNSAGSKVIKDYQILKLTSDQRAFTVDELINGISVVKNGGNNFVLYDQINSSQPNFIERRNNIYADNGKEFARIYKVSDEPKTGIKVIIKLTDADGTMFNPATYSTYAAGTYSYIDVSVNRQNTSDGMVVEFPTTPWPVDANFRSYLKGPTANDFSMFDIQKLYTDFQAGKVPSLITPAAWPANNWSDASAWFVRIRSIIHFYESGTWEISCKIPYTHINKIF